MSKWKECKLGDIIRTNVDSLSSTYSYTDILYLDTGSITSGKLNSYQKMAAKEAPSRARRLVKDRDIVYSTVRPIQRHYGFIKDPPVNLVVSTGFAVIETIKELADPQFVYNFLSSNDIVEYLDSIADGSTSAYPSLKPSDIENLDILLPPLPEQKAIAEVLSCLDDKIELLHRQNKTLEAMAEALFRQWFVEGASDDCEEIELEKVVETTSGGTPSRSNMKFYENGTIYWVKSKELNGTFIFDTEEKIIEDALKFSSAKLLPKNSILIAMYGATVGEYAIISEQMACNQAICALKPNEDYPYTYLFLLIKLKKEELINMAVGSAQQNISQQLIKKIPVLNCTERIKQFHLMVNPYFEKIKTNQQQISTLEKLRDTLLPKLMSGEVRVAV